MRVIVDKLPTKIKGDLWRNDGLLAPACMVFVYSRPMSDLRALFIIRTNIAGLLYQRKQSQTDLASWLRKDKSWINKFLNATREIQLKDLDRIADFFGIATYQLFQPGVVTGSERRTGQERRRGHDRRISHTQRHMVSVAAEIDRLRPRRQQTADRPVKPK
jgi:transcriptional regulator with XRE-family HTH domain